ncbi:hypothetical protein [Vibrio parahaemolyticus]|uniref:hypothetical protein n=1 Tax=Vibrio parahaemolyticus TaxID=670 RepID=UPI000C7E7479|nr:hypothetical protein [Vibrio parahaemolyticus]PLR57441.1 hypothetical protein CYU11_12215 [Vibrio parahaemolyticus]
MRKVVHLDKDYGHQLQYSNKHHSKTHVFAAKSLSEAESLIRQELPDIAQVDVYSPRSNTLSDKLTAEILLSLLGAFRYVVREECGRQWIENGKETAIELKKSLDESGHDNIPVAISSRYARRLLSGKELRDLEEADIYWVYKERIHDFSSVNIKDAVARAKQIVNNVFTDEFIERCLSQSNDVSSATDYEIESMEEVIRIHKRKVQDRNRAKELTALQLEYNEFRELSEKKVNENQLEIDALNAQLSELKGLSKKQEEEYQSELVKIRSDSINAVLTLTTIVCVIFVAGGLLVYFDIFEWFLQISNTYANAIALLSVIVTCVPALTVMRRKFNVLRQLPKKT